MPTSYAGWVVRYAVTCAVLVAGAGWLLGLHYAAPDDRHALRVASVVAVVLQVGAFLVARRMAAKNVVAGWGLGAAACMAGLMVFGFAAKGTGLALEPALFGLATFLFITELVEPLFLRP